jgi:hypothetical protein
MVTARAVFQRSVRAVATVRRGVASRIAHSFPWDHAISGAWHRERRKFQQGNWFQPSASRNWVLAGT